MRRTTGECESERGGTIYEEREREKEREKGKRGTQTSEEVKRVISEWKQMHYL